MIRIHHSSFIIHHFLLAVFCAVTSLGVSLAEDTTTDILCGVHSPTPWAPPSVTATGSGAAVAFYFTSPRWSSTATNGPTGSEGDPITLTFSYPADGVTVGAASGLATEVSSPNILHATLDGQFQSREIWQEQFRRIYMRWSLLSGVKYVEVGDDGAAFSTAQGVIGLRGDVRIAGHHIDGASGGNVLAYSFFPNDSELVVDTDNSWAVLTNNFRLLRNVLGHESGHGLGLTHPAARADTQWLMEPVISTLFDGPQEDDIRGVQRMYGDAWENNDTSATATNLGTIGASEGSLKILHLSTDHVGDIDWFKFTMSTTESVTITVTPVGTTYVVQAEGLPVQGTIDAFAIADLHFTLFAANATTVIADVNATGAGSAEAVTATLSAGQTYFVKVFDQPGTDDVQRYELSLSVLANLIVPPRAVAPMPRVSSTGRLFVTARESYDPDHPAAVNGGIVSCEWDLDNNGSFEFLGAEACHLYAIPGLKPCRLRVTDSDGETSVANFTVNVAAATETKSITITAPNSGAMIVGSPQTITWTNAGSIANVRIDISRDAGFNWTILTALTANTGTFTWPSVLAPNSNFVLFRVADASDPAIFDTTDNYLAISNTPVITLTAPVGGESFNVGYPVAITWTSSGVTQPILIELSRDGGATFPTVLAAAAPNTGSFAWTATGPTGVQNRIRVSDSSNAAIVSAGGDFTLNATPTLTVTAPNGGETIVQGTATSVTWTNTGTIANVKVEVSSDSGATFSLLTAAAPNTGTFVWNVTQAPGMNYRVRISDAAAPAVVSDLSDADFTIPVQTITVFAPNGGQTFTQGETRTITWITSGIVANVDIDVSTDGGTTFVPLAAAQVNTGSFDWFISQPVTAQALIRVADSSQPGVVTDVSDATFTILSGVGLGTITVLSPNGGEVLPAATVQTIRWSSTGFVVNVKIEVTVNGGAVWQTLAASTPNTGSFTWTTPSFFYDALLVRITDANPGAANVTDSSDRFFQIGLRPRRHSKGCAMAAGEYAGDAGSTGPGGLLLICLGVACVLWASVRFTNRRG